MRKRITASTVMIGTILVLAAFASVYPAWYTLIMSLSNKSKVAAGVVVLWPIGINTFAYSKVLQDSLFFTSFGVSVQRVFLGCTINMVLTILCAYPLSKTHKEFKLRRLYVWFLMFNMLFSGGLIPWYLNIRNYGLIDTMWALVLPSGLPIFNAILLMNFFRKIPHEISESAVIDGAGPWTILTKIFLQMSTPVLATVLLFSFVAHWNAYFDGLILINTPEKQPLQTFIYQLNLRIQMANMTSQEIKEWSRISDDTLTAAKVVVAMMPILAIYPFLQKYFVTGISLGAVKG